MREIELTEEERKSLEALYLRAELIARDILSLNSLLEGLNQQIKGSLAEIARKHGLEPSSLKPEFRGYQLIRLVHESTQGAESSL